jgi:hypothetical protein
LSGKKLPSGMTGSSSLSKGPGALPLTALRVRERVFSRTFLSFFAGTVAGVPLEAGTARVAEFRLDTRPNSSEWSVLGLWGLRVEVVVRERENRLGMEGFDPNDGQKEKGRSETTGDRRLFRALAFPLALSACPNPDGNTRHPSLRPHSPTQITSTATATATTGYHSSRTAFLTVPLIFFLFFSPFFSPLPHAPHGLAPNYPAWTAGASCFSDRTAPHTTPDTHQPHVFSLAVCRDRHFFSLIDGNAGGANIFLIAAFALRPLRYRFLPQFQ